MTTEKASGLAAVYLAARHGSVDGARQEDVTHRPVIQTTDASPQERLQAAVARLSGVAPAPQAVATDTSPLARLKAATAGLIARRFGGSGGAIAVAGPTDTSPAARLRAAVARLIADPNR